MNDSDAEIPVIVQSTHPLTDANAKAHDKLVDDLMAPGVQPPIVHTHYTQARARAHAAHLLEDYEANILCRRIKGHLGYVGIYQQTSPGVMPLRGFGTTWTEAMHALASTVYNKQRYAHLCELRDRMMRLHPAESYDICMHVLSHPRVSPDIAFLALKLSQGEELPEFQDQFENVRPTIPRIA